MLTSEAWLSWWTRCWYNKVDDSGFKSFNVIAATLYEHYDEVPNFFVNRTANAFAESFNAKIKAFRAALRGVTDIRFFFSDSQSYMLNPSGLSGEPVLALCGIAAINVVLFK